jgi:hypothetical protein
LGFVGALLVGLLGVMPYLYLGYNGYACAYAAFLIPLASAFGYYMFGGNPSLGKLIVCFILPLFLYLLAALGLLCYSVYASWFEAGYVFTLKELVGTVLEHLRTNPALTEEFVYRQALFGGLYLLIGYVFTLPTAFQRPEPYFAILKGGK